MALRWGGGYEGEVGREGGGEGGQPSRDPAGVLDPKEGSPEHERSLPENLVQLFSAAEKKKAWRVKRTGRSYDLHRPSPRKAAFVIESLSFF